MARNGSGGYSLPVNTWNPATNGVSATAADWQALINDVAAAVQQSISADGQTPITGSLNMGGNRLTALAAGTATGHSLRFEQLFSQGLSADVAAATTVDIGAQLSTLINVTGTGTITSFGTNYNGPRFIRFAGVCTLTNSATLVLPGGANITTAAGDSAIAVPLGNPATGWRVLSFDKADGGLVNVTSINGGQLAGLRNKIINGNFSINQRAYVSGAAVGANLYGHDRWKMAASADTYTFSTTANVTTVTIPAGKVLQQVIEGLNLETGTYTLSWSGTAQGKIGAGSYGASGITGSITGGTNTTIEFGPGTLSKVQLEGGAVATPFEHRPYGMELALCKRYGRKLTNDNLGFVLNANNLYNGSIWFDAEMRAIPTLDAGATFTATSGAAGTVGVSGATPRSVYFNNTGTGWTANAFVQITAFLSSEL